MEASARPASLKHLGAALGAASGPVAAFGQGWAGTGDGRAHVWVLATLFGALLGALTFPVFWKGPAGDAPATPADAYGSGFGALFGFAVGLVAGALSAFPMGSVMGALGGAVAGAITAFLAGLLRARRGGLVIAWVAGAGGALLLAWAWVQ